MTGLVLQLHAGFLLAGMATTLLGPVIPLLAAGWGLTDREAGALFTAQFTGALAATSVAAVVADRIGRSRALAAGFFLFAAGIGALGLVPRGLAPGAALTYGLGQGLVLPLTNIAIAAIHPVRPAGALSLVNVSWGVGAVLWPMAVRALARPADPAPATTALAAACLTIAVAWAVRHSSERGPSVRAAGTTALAASVPTAVVLAYGAMILLYVGAETSIGGWVAELARRTGAAPEAWTLAPTAFWASQTAGRLAAPLVLRGVTERVLLQASLAGAGAVTVGLVSNVAGPGASVAGAALAGLAGAAMFPLRWGGVTRDVAPGRPSMLGPLFAAGGAGGALLPWLVGVVSEGAGSLALALLVPCVAIGVILVLVPVAWRAPASAAAT